MGTLHFWPRTESTSLNLSQKIVTGDYVHDFYSYVKFGGNPSIGGFWANRWNITIHSLTDSRKGVFLALVDIAAHLGDQVAPKPQFWGRE